MAGTTRRNAVRRQPPAHGRPTRAPTIPHPAPAWRGPAPDVPPDAPADRRAPRSTAADTCRSSRGTPGVPRMPRNSRTTRARRDCPDRQHADRRTPPRGHTPPPAPHSRNSVASRMQAVSGRASARPFRTRTWSSRRRFVPPPAPARTDTATRTAWARAPRAGEVGATCTRNDSE